MPDRLPGDDALRDIARDVLSQPEYDLRPGPTRADRPESPLLKWLREEVLNPIDDFLNNLFGEATWLKWMAFGLLLAGIAWFVVRLIRARRRTPRLPSLDDSVQLTDLPVELERSAELAAARGDFANAARLHLRATVLRLEQAEHRVNRPGTPITNCT
ncbi:MAG: hypothetical protein R3B90_19680 [Planctomycetaceae bacterium]